MGSATAAEANSGSMWISCSALRPSRPLSKDHAKCRGLSNSIAGRARPGISLLEVLMAISLLGVSFATIFSGLSAALRATDRLDAFRSGQRICRTGNSASSSWTPRFGGRAGALRSFSFRYHVAGENPVG